MLLLRFVTQPSAPLKTKPGIWLFESSSSLVLRYHDAIQVRGGQIYLNNCSTSLSLRLWNSPFEMPWFTSPGPMMWGCVHSVGCPYFAVALKTVFSGIETLSNPENLCCSYFWEKCASGFRVIRTGHLILAALNPIILYLHLHVARFYLKSFIL